MVKVKYWTVIRSSRSRVKRTTILETVSLNLKFTAPDKNQTTAVVSPAPRRYTLASGSMPTPVCVPSPHSDKHEEEFQSFILGKCHFCRLRKRELALGLCVLKVPGSQGKVGGGWASSLQRMMVDCVSGRPTPTARFWKPAHVTMWLA